MKLKHALVLSLLALFSATAASASYCINKDLINLGPATAYDLGVILRGPQTLTWRYDGYPDGRFHSFSQSAAGTDTYLHWQNIGGVDGPIPPGKLIHVGWCTAGPHRIRNMFWTGLDGQRLPGSVIYNLTTRTIYFGGWRLRFLNDFEGGPVIVIHDVRVARIPAPFPLAELNRENQALADQLAPVAGGTSFSVAAGETVDLPLPDGVIAGEWLVVRYAVAGAESQAEAVDFVQFQVE